MNRSRNVALLNFAVWTTAFAVAFTQWPLFSENQNTKFLHGLAAAGVGTLNEDWLANTIDPLPAFSLLVQLTAQLLHPDLFYLYQALILGVYLFSLVGIADLVFDLNRTRVGAVFFMVAVIAMHSSLVVPFSLPVLGTSLGWLLQAGVANQYLFNPVFQPASFGALLVLSIYLFLRRKPFAAAATCALAGVFHSTYLPSAGVLTLAYVLITWWEDRNLLRAFSIGLVALIIALPVLIHSLFVLGPTTPETWAQAQSIIVRERIPHHSLPEIWLDRTVYVKIGIMLLALIVVRRTRLFPILLTTLSAAILFTLLDIRLDSDLIGFVAPWRMSVFLVPLSSSLLMAWAIAKLFNCNVRWVTSYQVPLLIVAAVALFLVVFRGAQAMQHSFADRRSDGQNGVYAYAQSTDAPGTRYLTPTHMADFRLATGRPVVVTWKSHPYLDVEVIEWKERIDAVNGFYNEPSCAAVDDLVARYGVTHLLFEGDGALDGCSSLESGYRDERFAVLVVKGAQ